MLSFRHVCTALRPRICHLTFTPTTPTRALTSWAKQTICKAGQAYVRSLPTMSSSDHLTYLNFNPSKYEELFQEKVALVKDNLGPFLGTLTDPIEEIRSPPQHYRMRCKLGIVTDEEGRLHYAMWSNGSLSQRIETFPIMWPGICTLMPKLLEELQEVPELKIGLRAVYFLAGTTGDMLLTFIYDRPIGDEWVMEARRLKEKFGVHLTGRCKGGVYLLDRDYIHETYSLSDGRKLEYKHVANSFSNPNVYMCQHTLDWLCARSKSISDYGLGKRDLLELYCGNGNHTIALAPFFRKVVAVEIDERLCEAATENAAENQATNVTIVHSPSEKFCRAVVRKKASDFEGVEAETVLVDPPRAGLDKDTKKLLVAYTHILYISCSNTSLQRDLGDLTKTHDLLNLAILDHFPYTPHIECGVYLRKRV